MAAATVAARRRFPRMSNIARLGIFGLLCQVFLYRNELNLVKNKQRSTLSAAVNPDKVKHVMTDNTKMMEHVVERISFPFWNVSNAQVRSEVQDSEIHLRGPSAPALGKRLQCPTPIESDMQSFLKKNMNMNGAVGSQITAIFTGSARYCHPHLSLIDAVISSHEQLLHGFSNMKLMFALDGYGDVGYNKVKMRKAKVATAQNISLSEVKYDEFKKRLREKYPQAEILELETNVGQRELVKRAIERVTTPIVYVAQDDFSLKVPVDGAAIETTMLNSLLGYNNVRYILLAKEYGRRSPKRHYKFYGPNMAAPLSNAPFSNEDAKKVYPNQTQLPLFVPESVCLPEYSRRVGFYSDNNHFALTELYSKYLLPRASKAKFLEDIHTQPALQQPELWGRYYGTHQYATHQVLIHLDGRDLKWCNASAAAPVFDPEEDYMVPQEPAPARR